MLYFSPLKLVCSWLEQQMLEWNDQSGSFKQAQVATAPPARSTFGGIVGRSSRRSADGTHGSGSNLTPGRSSAHDLTPGRTTLSNRAVFAHQRASARSKVFGGVSNRGRWTTEERGSAAGENDSDEIVVDIHVVHRQRLKCTPEVVEHLHKLHELEVHSLSWLEDDDRGRGGCGTPASWMAGPEGSGGPGREAITHVRRHGLCDTVGGSTRHRG